MLKALMLRKKIAEKTSELETLRAKKTELEAKSSELEAREKELESDIMEASTDEERSAVEEAVTAFEADVEATSSELESVEGQINDLEGEVSELERDLEAIETAQAPAKEAEEAPVEESRSEIHSERNFRTMFKTRSLRNMTMEQRSALVEREDVKETLAQVRTLIQEKRAVTGANLTIGTTILGLIRENVMEYSKLYSRVNVQASSGNGRVIVQGVAPEAIWLECCDALPEVALSFGQVELDCFKVGAYFAICNAIVEDSDIDILDALIDALNQALGLAIDKAILYGTGVKMPTGVVTALADEETGIAANLVNVGSATGKALFQKIVEASGNANSRYSRGAKVWVMNETTYTKLVSESMDFDASGAIVSGVNGTMPVVGGDIVVLNFVPDNNIVLGYFDLYVLLERLGVTIETSEHAKFIEDQTIIRAKARLDGKPAIPAAFVAIGIGAAPTTSVPFAGQNGEG